MNIKMVTGDDLNKFGIMIDSCKELLTRLRIEEKEDLSNAFVVLYSKALLTMSEIHCLLSNGYPEGAMSLARNTYETLVITAYLYLKREDPQLIKRFFDDLSIKTCSDYISYLKWYLKNRKDDSYVISELNRKQEEWLLWIDKYDDFALNNKGGSYFKQYWWAGKNMSFHKIREATDYSDSYLYDLSCYRVHAGMVGKIYFDQTEEGFLLAKSDHGKETPMFFALLNFAEQSQLFFGYHQIDYSSISHKMDSLFKTLSIYNMEIAKKL